MNIEGYIHGITTRSDKTLQEELDIKYARKPRRDKRDVLARDADELIALQSELGFTRISDGQLLWPDLFRPVYLLLNGVEVGSQTRWFETNGFTFAPKRTGTIAPRSSGLGKWLYKEKVPGDAVAKLTLPGPVTLAAHTEGAGDDELAGLVTAYGAHLAAIARDLVRRGYGHIEFAEPSLLSRNGSFLQSEGVLDSAKRAYSGIVKGLKATTIVQLFFCDPNRVTENVLELPVSGFLLDLVEAPLEKELPFGDKILVAGVLDSRSSVPEDIGFAAERALSAAKLVGAKELHVTTNGQLFYTIASGPARRKIGEIAQLVSRVREAAQ